MSYWLNNCDFLNLNRKTLTLPVSSKIILVTQKDNSHSKETSRAARRRPPHKTLPLHRSGLRLKPAIALLRAHLSYLPTLDHFSHVLLRPENQYSRN